MLDTTPSNLYLPRPFRFKEFWTYDSSCGSIISNARSSCFNGSPHFILAKKLKATKAILKVWNSSQFGNIQKRIAATLQQIDLIQQSVPSTQSRDLEDKFQKSLDDLLI